jgi:hypothetical protein
MTTKQITELALGTKVFLIRNAEIQAWETIGFHPKNRLYFYLAGNGSIEKTKCLFLDAKHESLQWETDYEKAKEVMWGQLKEKVSAINKIYMDNKKHFNFIENEQSTNL